MYTDPDAQKLAARPDGLPLALATAGDYLRQTPDSFAEYLKNYQESWQELSQYADELPDYEGRTLYSTWNLSLSLIAKQSPEAVEVLRFIAYFSSEDIRFELLQKATTGKHQALLHEALSSKLKFSQIMRKLQKYSLVESHEAGGYSLHTCVHDWTLDYLNKQIGHDLPWLGFHCVAVSFIWQDVPLS